MSVLWTSAEAESATLGKASRPFAASGLSIDTRTLKQGDLYIAIKGEKRDGHDFVREAFEAKAAAALVSRQPERRRRRRCSRSPTRSARSRIWRAPRAPAAMRKSSRSPAAPARPRPRKC